MGSDRFGRLRQLLKQHVKIVAVAAAVLALAGVVFADGIKEASTARKDWERSSAELQRQLVLAASLPATRAELDRTRREWEEARQGYEVSVDGGLTFGILGRLCRENGVRDVSVSEAGGDTAFHKNHLKARYFRVRVVGPFPAVFNVLQGLEASGIPAELKPLEVTASGTEVVAEGTLVLYSLSPPARVERVAGESGKYDPFFDYEIRKMEAEREALGQGRESGEEGHRSGIPGELPSQTPGPAGHAGEETGEPARTSGQAEL